MKPANDHLGVTRQLFRLAWPIVGINVLQVLALAVDTAMIGRTANAEDALTGMGYSVQLVFLLMVAMIGLTVGTVAFISRAHGAGNNDRAEHVLHQSVQMTIVLGIVVAIVGNLVAEPLLLLLGATQTTLPFALAYLRPLLLGAVFNYLMILFSAALRGVGNTRLAFFVSFSMNVMNLLFNYGLILGNLGMPALGIQGAAIGTVLSQFIASGLMAFVVYKRVEPGLYFTPKPKPIDRELVRDLIRVGWPAAADMLVLNAAFLAIIGMLGRIDQAAVAAHSIGLRVQALAFVPGMSISQAVGALVGQSLGANDIPSARKALHSGIAMNLAVMSTLGLILIVLAGPIVAGFGIEAGSDVRWLSVQWMELLGYSMPIVGVYIAFTGLLQGAGVTMVSLRINFFSTMVVQIPASYYLGFVVGLDAWGVWFAFPAVFILKVLWAFAEYRRGEWAQVGATV